MTEEFSIFWVLNSFVKWEIYLQKKRSKCSCKLYIKNIYVYSEETILENISSILVESKNWNILNFLILISKFKVNKRYETRPEEKLNRHKHIKRLNLNIQWTTSNILKLRLLKRIFTSCKEQEILLKVQKEDRNESFGTSFHLKPNTLLASVTKNLMPLKMF